MKIDIGVPNSMHVRAMVQPWEYALTGEDVCNAVALADRLGFYQCMLGEHFIVPNQHLDLSGAHYFHTAVALGVFGGCTKKLRLAPSVTIIGLQNPIVQAKAWSTLDLCLSLRNKKRRSFDFQAAHLVRSGGRLRQPGR